MGRCKFNEKWFEEDKFRGWLEKAGDYEARCRLSRKAFILGTMGAKALESHMRSQKYIRYSVAASGTTPMPVLFERSGLKSSASVASTSHQTALTGFVSPPETQKAEVLWVLHTVSRHNSFKSNEDISSVLAAMFPDSEFAKSFTCGENKTAYLAKYGIASFIKRELSRSVNDKQYVLMFDE